MCLEDLEYFLQFHTNSIDLHSPFHTSPKNPDPFKKCLFHGYSTNPPKATQEYGVNKALLRETNG